MSNNMHDDRTPSIDTLVAHAGGAMDHDTGGVAPTIAPSVTFARNDAHELPDGRLYLRYQSENGEHVERLLAQLEGGASALVFASGLAASTAVFLSILRPGDTVVATRVMYFGVRHWLKNHCAQFGMKLVLVDGTDGDAVAHMIRSERPKLVWIETPGNPMLDVVDIAATARVAREVGALLCVDSTSATPVLTRPIALGADVVMHSATKYLNGHCDVLAGALVFARDDNSARAVATHRKETGAVLGPFEAWLLLRGMRTLSLRVERQCANALAVATWLAARERNDVVEVLYPGLPTHRNHALAAAQMTLQGGAPAFGGLLSVRVAGGEERAMRVVKALRVFLRATSLGGVESFVEHRASVEGPDTTTPRDLLRLAIGIEDPRDLIDDLAQALDGTR
jgi:cystathionine gamma-synthase